MADDAPIDPTRLRDAAVAGWDTAMGFQYLRLSRDEVVVTYDVADVHKQGYGIVHGGVHCGVIESVCSTGAAMDAMPRGQHVVGLENHTSFVRAVRGGRITVTATPVTRGRRVQLWEATCRDEGGRIVATGRVRLLCLDPGTELGGETVQVRPRE